MNHRLPASHEVDDLLPDWGAYLRRENRGYLGVAQVQYTEFIARSQSATGYVDVDLQVLKLDELIRARLPAIAIDMLRLRYEQGVKDEHAARKLRMSRSELNRARNHIVLPTLRIAWDQLCAPERG